MNQESTPHDDAPKGRWKKRLLTWGITLALVAMTGCIMVLQSMKPRQKPSLPAKRIANVEVETVTTREYNETLTLPARLEADQSATISSEISGRLKAWEAQEGEPVQKGQIVARIDTEDLDAQLAELQAQLELDRARLSFAERELARIQKLAERDIATESELDTVEEARTDAKLSIAQTERRIDSLQVTLDKATLRAPFNGHIEEHLVEPGELVGTGQLMARIYDLSHLRAIVDVPDRYIPFLEADNPTVATYIAVAMPGAKQNITAKVEIPGPQKLTGGTYQGITLDADVVRVAQASNPLSNTFEVELRLPNPGGALREGIICRSHITFLTYAEAIVIPLKSIEVADVGPRVKVVERRDGRDYAQVRNIEPVSIDKDRILIAGGLQPGDRLLVTGGKGVLDGEPVAVIIEDGKSRKKTYDPGMKAADWLQPGTTQRIRKLLERGRESTSDDTGGRTS